jgi:hypothetical protein
MDPNATLAEIRALIERWQAAGSRGPWTEAEADQLIEKVADLDKWLTRGGFLPDPWATPDRVTTETRRRDLPRRDPYRNRGPIF